MNTTKLQEISIKYFNKYISSINNDLMVAYGDMVSVSMKHGYFINPNFTPISLYTFFNEKVVDNYNTTFYKTWSDITSRNLLELYIDKISHYTSTYGTNFTGETYVINDNPLDIDFKSYKYLDGITLDEYTNRILELVYGNVALKRDTIDELLYVLNELSIDVDINKIRNNEVRLLVCVKLDKVPTINVKEFVRFLIYKATGETLLIKNRNLIDKIKTSNIDISKYVSEFGYSRVSESFLRFKDILIAFKKSNINNISVINKLNRLAKSNHRPTKRNTLEYILSDAECLPDFINMLNCGLVNNFKKVSLLNSIVIKLQNLENRFFLIRNQKMYTKKNDSVLSDTYINYLETIYDMIYKSLCDSLKSKATNVILSDNIDLMLPSSEKSFIGNYPMGTVFNLPKNDTIVGIHWRGIDGATDLDLNLTTPTGERFGWNTNYTSDDNAIIYSGDMTSANPEASELMYTKGGFKETLLVKVNGFNASIGAKFRLFLASENITNMQRSYMVDKNNIIFDVDCSLLAKGMVLGILMDGKFILSNFSENNNRVAGNTIFNKYISYALNTCDSYLNLRKVLVDSGFNIVEDVSDLVDGSYIDLRSVSKDSLIKILM